LIAGNKPLISLKRPFNLFKMISHPLALRTIHCIETSRHRVSTIKISCVERQQQRPRNWGGFAAHPARAATQQHRRPTRWRRTPSPTAAALTLAAAATIAPSAGALAFVPPVCFDQECAAGADAAFLVALAVPLLAAAALAAYVLRPPPAHLVESGRVFEDPATGTLFEAPEGVTPEVDKNVRALCCVSSGWLELVQMFSSRCLHRLQPPPPHIHTPPHAPQQDMLAFKPISYTPWPVPADAPGERIRIGVGKAGSTELR